MSYPVFLFLKTACAVGFALSLYPTALCGRHSLGHAGTLAMGAYLFATTRSVSVTVAVLFCWGFLVSYLTSHVSDGHFGALTLALGEGTRIFLSNLTAVGGASGLVLQKRYPFFPVISLVLTLAVTYCFSKTKTALYCKALCDDEIALKVLGKNTRLVKSTAYALSCALCALSAVGYSSLTGFIMPADFSLSRSYEALSCAVLGGGVWGITLWSVGLEGLTTALSSVGEVKMLVYGVILILISKKDGGYVKGRKHFKTLWQNSGAKRRVVLFKNTVNTWNNRH